MELHKDTAQRVIDYLVSHGYPEEAIIAEYPLGRYRADIVVIDPITNFPLMVIEIKGIKSQTTFRNGVQQLKRFQEQLGVSIPAYLAFASGEQPYFEIIKVDEFSSDNIQATSNRDKKDMEFIKYRYLRNSSIPKQNLLIQKKRSKQSTREFVFSSILSVIILLTLILDLCSIIELDTEHIWLIVLLVLVILFPFIKKFKYKDLEIEKLKRDEKDND